MPKQAVADADSNQGDFGDPLPFDPHFKGPIKNRSCTDILCLFLFVAFIAGWAVVAYFAYSTGDPKNLLNPTDSEGNVCGHGDFADRRFLYFFDITKCIGIGVAVTGCKTPQVCVKECPKKNILCTENNCPFDKLDSKDLICTGKVDESKSVKENLEQNHYNCVKYYFNSEPLAGRCLPIGINFPDEFKIPPDKGEEVAKNLAEFRNARDLAVRMFEDFAASWPIMIIFLLLAMVVSFLWILLMRWIAGIMVMLSIILAVALLGFASGFSFYTYYQIDKNLEVDAFKSEFIKKLDTFTSSKTTWLISGIIFGVVWLIIVLMLIFLRKRIILAIALIKEGSKAVGSTISSLFFPLFPYLLQLAVFAFWGSVAIYIASSGKAQAFKENTNGTSTTMEPCNLKEEGSDISKCMFSKYEGKDNMFRAQIYNLFGLFWGLFFVVGLGQVSLAGAFASYYWAFNKSEDVPYFAVAGGMYRAFRFHLGSIAFGSLLIAVVRMIRVMLDYIDQECKKYKNTFTKIVIVCCKCCFWCLERFLRFISKNAYIMMSVYGKNFCTSAKDSFKLLMRNVVRVVVLDKVTDYLLLLGKLVVVGITAVAAFFFFKGDIKYVRSYSPDLNYYFLPVITVTIGSYLIATGFFNVYSMAVDTLFLCFLEDCERNDGSPERPYYMSRELMKILGKKNKFREQS